MKIHLKGIHRSQTVYLNGKQLHPQKSQKVSNHSPDGFNWGYGGSGPAQLALAILLELMPKERAVNSYQQFKWEVIAGLPQSDFDKEIEFELESPES